MGAMDAACCRRCGRAFTSGEITGLGILRPRRADHGGPFVEFACPDCRTVHRLVPHGQGRFAPPGEPPPPPPDEVERRVPWHRPAGGRAPAEPAPVARTPEPPVEAPRPRAATPPPVAPPARMSAADALATLGVAPTATREQIEEAYRAIALRLHPDKVAHLDEELVALAERKFRRVQEARDVLVGD
jgi:hypothetical protein